MNINTNLVSSVQQRPAKRSKSKKKPIKVVYISNPMKVKTSASKFRALVQELTGQDAEFPPDLTSTKFQDQDQDHNNSDDGSDSGGSGGGVGIIGSVGGGHLTESENSVTKIGDDHNHTLGMHQVGQEHVERFEPFDDVFTPQMIESFSAFLPASVFYESAQVDQ